MDLDEAIRALLEEKKRLDHLIAVLEELEQVSNHGSSRMVRKRRGRKSMSLEERRQVSERMKRYWAQRKQQQAKAQAEAIAARSPHTAVAGG